jgi:cyclase
VFAAEASVGRARALTSGGGHTESDAVVHVAEADVLVCGDLLFVGIQPWVGHGDPRSWLASLDRIAELDAALLVPGHGPVSGPESLAPLRDSLRALVDAVDSETVVQAPARFAEWDGAEMWARNLDALRERSPSAS